jgi:hypothetical protein
MSADLPSQIHSELAGLDSVKQRQVLTFIRSLKGTPKGVQGFELKRFAGTLTQADAQTMIEAVEAGCEQVDVDEW